MTTDATTPAADPAATTGTPGKRPHSPGFAAFLGGLTGAVLAVLVGVAIAAIFTKDPDGEGWKTLTAAYYTLISAVLLIPGVATVAFVRARAKSRIA